MKASVFITIAFLALGAFIVAKHTGQGIHPDDAKSFVTTFDTTKETEEVSAPCTCDASGTRWLAIGGEVITNRSGVLERDVYQPRHFTPDGYEIMVGYAQIFTAPGEGLDGKTNEYASACFCGGVFEFDCSQVKCVEVWGVRTNKCAVCDGFVLDSVHRYEIVYEAPVYETPDYEVTVSETPDFDFEEGGAL